MTEFLHPHELAAVSAVEDPVRTAGRVRAGGETCPAIGDAHAEVAVDVSTEQLGVRLEPGALVRVEGRWDGELLAAEAVEIVDDPPEEETTTGFGDRAGMLDIGEASRIRAEATAAVQEYFESQDFLEVETPHAVESPGTDIYLQPVGTRSVVDAGKRGAPPWLHTSPEFSMKRMLCEGFTRIWQQCRVWRDGEVTDRHNPEFTMLEWYRAWEGAEAVMVDVEAVVRAVCGPNATVVERTPEGAVERTVDLEAPFEQVTMQELVEQSCGFDLLEALEYADLREACAERGLLERSLRRRYPEEDGRWDELFFELMVTELEPALAEMGAVFVTEWPAPLAVLARKKPDDPRVAERFELFVGGMELANGFAELTDPDEQRARFERDLRERRTLDLPDLPMPETFLEALEYGLPPSTGVALGFDRLLMAKTGAATLREVAPFAQGA